MIERCREMYPVVMMCRLLKVSPSGFYDWVDRPLSQRDQANEKLLEQISEMHQASDGVLGAPRIHEELNAQGMLCGINRVARLMRQHGIRGIPQKKQWGKRYRVVDPRLLKTICNETLLRQSPIPNGLLTLPISIPIKTGCIYVLSKTFTQQKLLAGQ